MMFVITRLRLVPIIALTCLVVVDGSNVRADEEPPKSFENAITNMATNVAAYLEENNETSIAMGAFAGPNASTAGRSIQVALTDALEKDEIKVIKFGANWTLRGTYRFEKRRSMAIVLLTAELVDRNGSEVSGFRERIESERIESLEDITRILGLTVDVTNEREANLQPAQATGGGTDAEIEAQADIATAGAETLVSKVSQNVAQPSFQLAPGSKTQLIAEANSRFRIEFLVRRAGQASFIPAEIQDGNGIAFVDGLEVGDVYRIRIYNHADHDVGVKLSIDGINCFALSAEPEFKKLGTWLVPAGQSGTISGWYLSRTRISEFLLSDEEEIPGLPPSNGIGTVTAQFFHAWKPNVPPPPIELYVPRQEGLRTRPGLQINRTTQVRDSVFGTELLTSLSLRYSFPIGLPPAN